MSEQDFERSPMRSSEAHRNAAHNDTLDDAANNSIIGKVKSRVSSIFPNSLSKWFSPSTKNNEALNGGAECGGSLNFGTSRRRRRIEIDDDDDDEYDDNEDAQQQSRQDDDEEDEEELDDEDNEDVVAANNDEIGEYDENTLVRRQRQQQQQRQQLRQTQQQQQNDNNFDEDDDDDSNSSDHKAITMPTSRRYKGERIYGNCAAARQPPAKKSRLNLDHTTSNILRENPLLQRQPLVASTPAMGAHLRGGNANSAGRSSNRFTHLNLYGGKQGNKEPAFNFHTSFPPRAPSAGGVIDIIDLVPEQAIVSEALSSRRSLNIPATTTTKTHQSSSSRYASGYTANLKRQSLSSVKHDFTTSSTLPRHTSTSIYDTAADSAAVTETTNTTYALSAVAEAPDTIEADEDDDNDVIVQEEEVDNVAELRTFNGGNSSSANFKRQKLTNGANTAAKTAINLCDSSESSDGGKADNTATATTAGIGAAANRKLATTSTGLFNLSSGANSRNGSRSSSFGNAMSFYTHLEGRKSLFAGGNGSGNANNTLNNSTLSLNSLNRRQFNASIYGSTSALSDSRLLNTFSPFYKGKTTYGGAAAYNKYAAAIAGAGASAVRITPTLIRPTSSLSTLSSSSNSLAAAAAANTGADSSAISSTAKRILDLINDFATPLSEAKKMASNLKQQLPATAHLGNKSSLLLSSSARRFNDNDLNNTRAMRLSQVRTPYMRPSLTLQPTTKPTAATNTALPPVRELQVPSMSQLLQMKKMQCSTERARQIAGQQQPSAAAANNDYTLAVDNNNSSSNTKNTQKMKSKLSSSSARISNAVYAEDEPAPPPLQLPTIAFPLMQSVPQFDIKLPCKMPEKTAATVKTVTKLSPDTLHKTTNASKVSTFEFKSSSSSSPSTVTTTVTTPTIVGTVSNASSIFGTNSSTVSSSTTTTFGSPNNFKFSTPLQLSGISTPTQNITPINANYKFSPPMLLPNSRSNNETPTRPSTIAASPPPLKTGSVLDALKSGANNKPIFINSSSSSSNSNNSSSNNSSNNNNNSSSVSNNSLFAQFKKTANEWECSSCMLRNQESANKCVACEVPRKTISSNSKLNTMPLTAPLNEKNSFGSQFKKSSNEWECEACMLRNQQTASKCVACETPLKTVTSNSNAKLSALPLSNHNTFGDAFKAKSNSWSCPTCMINNNKDSLQCVACETKQPGAVAAGAKTQAIVPSIDADAGFKSLAAAQSSAKWECEACMTRNDATKLKCVCCEQAKPGTQNVAADVPKFAFGNTAAAKFSFGFGGTAGGDARKQEEELRKTAPPSTTVAATTALKTTAAAPTGFVFGAKPATATTEATSTVGSFTFGTKSAAPATAGQDVADSKKPTSSSTTTTTAAATIPTAVATSTTTPLTGFKFGATSSATTTKVATSDANATKPAAGFTFGATAAAAAFPKTTENKMFNISSADSKQQPTPASSTAVAAATPSTFTATVPAFPSTPALAAAPAAKVTAAPSFSFGLSKAAAEAPKSGGFAFAAPAATAVAASAAATTSISAAPATTAASTGSFTFGAAATTTAAVKPTFQFGASPAAVNTNVANAAKPAAGGFSFGSSSNATTAAASTTTATVKPMFGANTTAAAAPASNVFGSFGSPANTAASSSGSAFGSASANTFGSLAANSTASPFGSPKPASATTATPTFGAAATPSTSTFTFGSSNNNATATPTTTVATTTSSTWPKNSFVFGSATATAPTASGAASTVKPATATFGGFGAAASNNTAAPAVNSSIFGNPTAAASSSSPATASATFGSAAAVPIFGSASTPSASSTNLFGSPSTPAFGASPFGSSGGAASATPTFGGTAATTTASSTFGGFGAAAAAASASDGASAAKKSEPAPAAFSFGAPLATTGTFNFGTGATAGVKPAFNFGGSTASSTPSFNFTGNSETTTSATHHQPFQFGAVPTATAAAPVFNFSGGAAEATSNAPFQFNAGAAPPSSASNIFAPTPTPGAAQSAQQARRKIRAPMRRLTPR